MTDVTDEAAELTQTDGVRAAARPEAGRTFGNDDPSLRHQWHPVARVDEIGPDPVRVELCGEALRAALTPEAFGHKP